MLLFSSANISKKSCSAILQYGSACRTTCGVIHDKDTYNLDFIRCVTLPEADALMDLIACVVSTT
ncbi:uncharacterized protein PHALS_04024 [Plasmopara halstedii]|uniref:Uncharacterized protein n=1 Tax=Plasmopara halstedii TaxID=4781 RepID=A0A0P1A8X0_PLAHL|nr:uncharacterized protein PHALS_04024 [Plasmopara halstedii]CEG36775.1 hypothetical protein PHALS_04024 [Plasmopara halstedii]|eukprot:XP_024573144.1 hypothetical protein PHALS_04024 [Plasmopara halstedii]